MKIEIGSESDEASPRQYLSIHCRLCCESPIQRSGCDELAPNSRCGEGFWTGAEWDVLIRLTRLERFTNVTGLSFESRRYRLALVTGRDW